MIDLSFENWLKLLNWSRSSVMSNKCRGYIYKFFMRIVPFGRRLFKMKIADSDKCMVCKNEIEELEHLYWNCPSNKELWSLIFSILDQLYPNEKLELNMSLMLLGWDVKNNVILCEAGLMLIIFAKNYIHICKCVYLIPNVHGLKNYIKDKSVTERRIYERKQNLQIYLGKWDKINQILYNNT